MAGAVVAGLSGTGRVADDLYLVAHHEISGRPYVQPRPLGLGLAGGLVAELMLAGHVTLRHGELAGTGRAAPGDGVTGPLLTVLAGERERRPVRDWLLFAARTAAGDVARRLADAGYLWRAGGRWRGRRWVPADPDNAFAPLLRARCVLDSSRPLTVHGALLAGLAGACGLGFRVAQYAPRRADRSVEQAVAQLQPGLRELIGQTQAAVDSALLAHRV
jgi:Golgi phosphoprotein 3 (GPP34)